MRIQAAKDLGALVRTQRKKKGWTQTQLADQIGVQPLWISQFERGKTTAQIGLVLRALRALDLSLSVGDSNLAGLKATAIDLDTLVYSIPDEIIVEEGSTLEKTISDSLKRRKESPE